MEINVAPSITVETLLDVKELKKNFSIDMLFSVVKRYDQLNVRAKITLIQALYEISNKIECELDKDNFIAPEFFWIFLATEYPFAQLGHASLRNMPVDTSITFMSTFAPTFSREEYLEFCQVLSEAPKSNLYGLPLSYIEKLYPFIQAD